MKVKSAIFKTAIKERKILSIYTDEDISIFSVGYVVNVFEEAILINLITSEGSNDGFALINMSIIYLIEFDNLYLSNLEKLIKSKNIEFQLKDLNFKRNSKKLLIIDFMNFCKNNNYCISIKHYRGLKITGFIVNFDEDDILLDGYTEKGEKDGSSLFKIEDIEIIYLLGLDQKKIEELPDIKQLKKKIN